jgi:Tfp pilus assembly protein PilO
MASLKHQPQRLKSRQIKLAVAVGAIAVGSWMFSARPMSTAVAQTSATRLDLEEQLVTAQLRAQQLPALRGEVQQLRRQVDRFKPLPPRSQLNDVQRDLSALIDASVGVSSQVDQGTEVAELAYIEQPFQYRLEGNFESVMDLIYQLETMDRLVRIRSMTVRVVDPQAGTVSVDLSLRLFFSEE